MSKIRYERRPRRPRYADNGTGKMEFAYPMGSRPGRSRKDRRTGTKIKPNFPGKNTLGRRRRVQEQDTPEIGTSRPLQILLQEEA